MDGALLDALSARVSMRFLSDEVKPPEDVIYEFVQGAYDRVSMRLAPYDMPEAAFSIVVEAAVRALRQRGVEGSSSESYGDSASLSMSFINDVLAAFEPDISALKKSLEKKYNGGGIRFL